MQSPSYSAIASEETSQSRVEQPRASLGRAGPRQKKVKKTEFEFFRQYVKRGNAVLAYRIQLVPMFHPFLNMAA
jgi:hypothetical protein